MSRRSFSRISGFQQRWPGSSLEAAEALGDSARRYRVNQSARHQPLGSCLRTSSLGLRRLQGIILSPSAEDCPRQVAKECTLSSLFRAQTFTRVQKKQRADNLRGALCRNPQQRRNDSHRPRLEKGKRRALRVLMALVPPQRIPVVALRHH